MEKIPMAERQADATEEATTGDPTGIEGVVVHEAVRDHSWTNSATISSGTE